MCWQLGLGTQNSYTTVDMLIPVPSAPASAGLTHVFYSNRRDWEAERARIAAAEAEVARLLSEQQAEFAEREERLIQIRWGLLVNCTRPPLHRHRLQADCKLVGAAVTLSPGLVAWLRPFCSTVE